MHCTKVLFLLRIIQVLRIKALPRYDRTSHSSSMSGMGSGTVLN